MYFCTKCLYDVYVPSLTLNGNILSCVKQHYYLSVVLCSNQADDCDIDRQMKTLYARGNILVCKFRSCSGEVKDQLFKRYFANLYCGQLWSNFNISSLNKLKEAYNNVFRFLNNIKRGFSISGLFSARNIHGFSAIHTNVINGLSKSIFSSSNDLIKCICQPIFLTYSTHTVPNPITVTTITVIPKWRT